MGSRRPLIEPCRDEYEEGEDGDKQYERDIAAFDTAVDRLVDQRREEGRGIW